MKKLLHGPFVKYLIFLVMLFVLCVATIQFSAYTRARTIHGEEKAGVEALLSIASWTERERNEILSSLSPAPSYGTSVVNVYDVAVGIGASCVCLLFAAITYRMFRPSPQDGFHDYPRLEEMSTEPMYSVEQIRYEVSKSAG